MDKKMHPESGNGSGVPRRGFLKGAAGLGLAASVATGLYSAFFPDTAQAAADPGANNALSDLTDDFSGTALNTSVWYDEPATSSGLPSGTVTVSKGTLSLAGGNFAETGYYTSVNAWANDYVLAGSHAFVRVIPNTTDADYDTGFSADLNDPAGNGDGWAMGQQGGKLYVESIIGSTYTPVYKTPYDAEKHAWMKISESGGRLSFSTAPDGKTWTVHWSTESQDMGAWTPAATGIQLYYGSQSGAAKPRGTARFQSFNVVPGGSSKI